MIRLPDAIRAGSGNYEFKGWSLNGDEGTLYQAGDEVVVDKELAKGADTLTFTAEWGGCIHTDSWQMIIEQMKKDPHVYDECIRQGCTKSVELTFPSDSPLFDNSVVGRYPDVIRQEGSNYVVKYAVALYGIDQDEIEGGRGDKHVLTFGPAAGVFTFTKGSKCHLNSGTDAMDIDGTPVLNKSLNWRYKMWNNRNVNSGGWPASRIRTTLNGSDKCDETDPSVAGSDLLNESQALISAFPQELQDAIVPKVVMSNTVYNSEDWENVETTYDKLWLFSGAEIYQRGSMGNDVIRHHEGLSGDMIYYQRTAEMNTTTTNNYHNNSACDELLGAAADWWLRTIDQTYSERAVIVESDGSDYSYNASRTDCGLAPGFCLSE